MAWATTIVAPPDGAMSDYAASLRKLARSAQIKSDSQASGPSIGDASRFVGGNIPEPHGPRVLDPASAPARARPISTALVRAHAIYIGIDQRLTGAAGMSVLARGMEDLVKRGVTTTDSPPSIDGDYRLAS